MAANKALVSRNALVVGDIALALFPEDAQHTFERLSFFGQRPRDALRQRVDLRPLRAEHERAV